MTQESTQAKGLAYLKTKKYPNSHLPWALPRPSWRRLLAMGRGAWSARVQDTVSESKPEKQPLGNNGWELEERMPQLSDLFSGIQGPSILAPRFSRGMEPQMTLGGDRLEITPVLSPSPLPCCCVLGSPPKHTRILVSGSSSQGVQTMIQRQTNKQQNPTAVVS